MPNCFLLTYYLKYWSLWYFSSYASDLHPKLVISNTAPPSIIYDLADCEHEPWIKPGYKVVFHVPSKPPTTFLKHALSMQHHSIMPRGNMVYVHIYVLILVHIKHLEHT